MKYNKFIVLLIFSVSLTLVACSTDTNENNASAEEEVRELVIADWGGTITEAHKKTMFEPFEEQFNVSITIATPSDVAKLTTMVENGNVEWNLANIAVERVPRLAKQDILEKLNYDKIENREGVPDEIVFDEGIGESMSPIVLAYNTDAYPDGEAPKNWTDFWNVEKFPGTRSHFQFSTYTIESALLADGVSPEELYPLDIDRAFESLDKIKPHIQNWWRDGAESQQNLTSGSVDMSSAYNGRILTSMDEGAPVELEYTQQLLSANAWVIPKGAENQDLATEFINFSLSPEVQADFSKEISYAPGNTKALELLNEEDLIRIGQTPEDLETQVFINAGWWADNFEDVDNRFQEWLLE